MSVHGFHRFVLDHSPFNSELPLVDQMRWIEEAHWAEIEWAMDAYAAASGRPFGQPALVSDGAAARLHPSGFDQAQGGGR